jgi:SAM-dependent methyltransferase
MGDHPNYLDIPCPVCFSARFKVKYPDTLGAETPCFDYDFRPAHTRTYRIVKCLDCGHGYSSPRPARLSENYQTTEDGVYLRDQRQRLATARKVVPHLLRFLPQGRLLDVGCATGDFLSVAREYFKVEGLEISEWSADIARSKGFVIHNGELGSIKANETYDVITLWGVIEHFEEPVREVKNIARLLRKGGIVGVWTGDFESSLSWLLGRKWWWVQGQHINLFSKRSLHKLFDDQGFEVVEIRMYPHVVTMESISRSLGRYPFMTKITKFLLTVQLLADKKITLKLPGEIFAIFRKR